MVSPFVFLGDDFFVAEGTEVFAVLLAGVRRSVIFACSVPKGFRDVVISPAIGQDALTIEAHNPESLVTALRGNPIVRARGLHSFLAHPSQAWMVNSLVTQESLSQEA